MMDGAQGMETAVDRNIFREAMSRLGAAVCVVTSNGPAGRCGTTVTAVSSVTDTPATLLVCLNRNARANAVIRGNGLFCVNVLTHDHVDLAGHFAGQTGVPSESRLDGIDHGVLVTGAPVLDGALVAFDCRVQNVMESGTHSIFLAQVADIRLGDEGKALMYFQRRYAALDERGA
ncbi:MAG: flavin reductase [Rhodobacteraceae bacterium]|jgi:flavin reductase|nr:flavin reductase [Paracoccaceae bacterium]